MSGHAMRTGLASGAVALTLWILAAPMALAGPTTPLSLDRLYRLPWITGTAPKEPRWAPDSQRLAFLWNDDGGNFYDVWISDRDDVDYMAIGPVRQDRGIRSIKQTDR